MGLIHNRRLVRKSQPRRYPEPSVQIVLCARFPLPGTVSTEEDKRTFSRVGQNEASFVNYRIEKHTIWKRNREQRGLDDGYDKNACGGSLGSGAAFSY